jgi:hypothetical protein
MKFVNVTVRVPNSNIVISESHETVEKAMDRGDALVCNLGGSWSLTFNTKEVR